MFGNRLHTQRLSINVWHIYINTIYQGSIFKIRSIQTKFVSKAQYDKQWFTAWETLKLNLEKKM